MIAPTVMLLSLDAIGRVPQNLRDASAALGHLIGGRLMVMLDRGDYWQCAYVIPKGGYDAVRARGLPSFRAELALFVPPPAGG